MPKSQKTEEEVMPQAILVDELSRYYGVEFAEDTDKKQFIHDLTKESHKIAKERPNPDVRKDAEMEAKIGQLRVLWADELSTDETDQQKQLRDKLTEDGYKVSVTFPDADSYLISTGGKEDSGSMSTGIPAIVGVVEAMVNPQGY